MNRIPFVTGLAALVCGAAVLVPSADATPSVPGADAPMPCGHTSWWAGTIETCGDTILYLDYVFDDYGADTRPIASPNWDVLSSSTGDVRYSDHDQAENTADLLALALTSSGSDLEVTARFNTMFEPDDARVVLAFDTDGVADEVDWPGTIAGNGQAGTVPLRATGADTFQVLDGSTATVDTDANTISGVVAMPHGPFRAWAVVTTADGTVTNAAFRGPDETGPWMENLQAAALAEGDITPFAIDLDPAAFTTVDTFAPEPGNDYERVYTSEVTIDRGDGVREGMSYDGVPGRFQNGADDTRQVFHTFGHHQPYTVYLPDGWNSTVPSAMQLILHGNGGSHRQIIEQPGAQARFGDDLDRVLLGPLGRGPKGFYSDESERDVLDAWADLETVLPVDADEVFTSGYSMGGYGSYRLASLYPDRFAGIIVWVGPTGFSTNGLDLEEYNENNTSGYVGNVKYYWSNLRNNHAFLLYGAADELVQVDQALLVQRSFADLGIPHSFWLHTGEHLTFAVADDWRKEAAASAGLRRVERPARITYRVEPRVGNPALGLVHDRAWWVQDLRAHRSGYFEFADVDLTTSACPGVEVPIVTEVTDVTTRVGSDPVPWAGQHFRVTGTATPASTDLTGVIDNVASMTLDASYATGACLEKTSFTYDITTSDAATIDLTDRRTLHLSPGRNAGTLSWPTTGGRNPHDSPRTT